MFVVHQNFIFHRKTSWASTLLYPCFHDSHTFTETFTFNHVWTAWYQSVRDRPV